MDCRVLFRSLRRPRKDVIVFFEKDEQNLSARMTGVELCYLSTHQD
ncbi:MAG: hypothetical protein K2Y18_02470 [Alphaproteobacteria bacterium]|jgi:hypothetical protein|nr:hypothetical protein [Alphaproteobacteria bacterium]